MKKGRSQNAQHYFREPFLKITKKTIQLIKKHKRGSFMTITQSMGFLSGDANR